MNLHQRWAQNMMRNEGRPISDIEREAADRERRRIRDKQREALAELYGVRDHLPMGEARAHLTVYLRDIDAATRAKRSKRK